ncbi:DUF2383 domain-containing protein [Pendulispora albinea]|uniref:PA2169 family four-helix-bundle protein n=1 Tax=Pendulispora albinea TaxID=2741071 RepID=A0ABZ2LSL2_9BACT
MTTAQSHNVDQLNSFLRGEISAVETYRKAVGALDKSVHIQQLTECQQSHEQRVAILSEQIRRLGGTPADSSGIWGAFAKLVEGGASALGEKTAIAALEEGEDHGNRDYQSDLPKLDREVRALIEARVLPLQQRTHAALSALKKRLS